MKGSVRNPPSPHHAPRGDLFREQFEKDRAATIAAAPDVQQRTPERACAEIYGRLSTSFVFHGRKTPKGRVDDLRRRVGSNRYAEFDSRLQRIAGVKGSSLIVRYASLLSIISKEIENIATDFRYTDEMYEDEKYDPTKEARRVLAQARDDIAMLPKLFQEMQMLCYRLHSLKRMVALQSHK